ncbi:erythroid differentiation-related factor 1-like [Liolophura sinensis]|uniref:erythroid differentiation-related factor 1-like n=1 Tax=Liolophura sinensis TaxID=3198878 RepID=UPI0031583E3C
MTEREEKASALGSEPQGQVMEWRPRCDVQSVDDKKNATVEANFLSPNTDLNLPPSNWLRSSSQVERNLRDSWLGWKQTQREFSSFNMGNEFPEFIGEVDVISDAENIKKLLKIPYNKAHVSMMVHRVRKTLLLDDFDIHKHLLRQQEADWEWMRKFYQETVMRNREEKMKCVKKNKSRYHLQNRNLYSKFLYYSVSDTDGNGGVNGEEREQPAAEDRSVTEDSKLQIVPESQQQSGEPGFHREVLWTFEDIQMLIGTDLPVFRAGHHPCVSVRLRDMSEPVNVLTGMDYWLDNLMCNVPELAMCYHLNGIVQNYELIKTAEIPNLDNSKFSPQEVTDIAKNILSFLKSNATKEGHTYWLYKGVDDDVVKLYDLTTLCADYMETKNENPFTVPLGMLLYRVARNMWKTATRKHASTIRTLLNTCVMLLDQEKYAQVYTSAHFLLADVYVPDSVVSDVWGLSSNNDESDSECEDAEQDDDKPETSKSVKVQSLSQPEHSEEKKRTAVVKFNSALFGTAEEKCRECIKCIIKGITCLNKHMSASASSNQEETQATCNPDEAIPLFYEPLYPKHKTDPSSADQNTASPSTPNVADSLLSTYQSSSPTRSPSERWHLLSKVLLYRKAAMAYYSLATITMESQKYGTALKYIKLAILCFGAMNTLLPAKGKDNKPLLCVILGTVADIRLMIAHNSANMETFQHDFQLQAEADVQISEAVQEDLPEFDKEWMYTLTDSIETNLRCCGLCYDEARQIALSENMSDPSMLQSLAKRFGNAMNELGVLHMNKALAVVTGTAEWRPVEEQEIVWKLSYSCFDQGVQAFESVGDITNQALLLSNIGQLMRICAQAHAMAITDGENKREFCAGERHYYTKAINFYQKALTVLSSRPKLPQIWDSVNWELSTTYFNMAMLLQDHAPVSSMSLEQTEKEITELMNKALRHCDVERNSCKAVGYQYRAATINYRLASLHHNSYRKQANTEQKRKYLRQIAFNHYDKAAMFFELTESFSDLLRVHLEQVALCEFCLEELQGSGLKCKMMEDILGYLLSCKTTVAGLVRLSKEKDCQESCELAEWDKLLNILKSRLLHILLSLMKQYSKLKKGKEGESNKLQKLNTMYSSALQGFAADDRSVVEKCECAEQVLSLIENTWIGENG